MKSFDWNQWLKNHPVFSCMDAKGRKRLLEEHASQQLVYPPESIVISQGDTSNDIFLIASGSASVCLTGNVGNKISITHLVSGEFFGEIASVQHKTRTATIIADEELTVLRINGHHFTDLLKNNSELEFRILMVISERLRSITQNFAVNVKELDEKLALFGHKLDATVAKLEANQNASDGKTEAKLQATEVMFQETKESANHIIDDAQRQRSRMTTMFSTLGGAFAILAAVAGFFGIQKYSGISKVIDDSVVKIEKISDVAQQSVNSLLSNIEENNEKISQQLQDAHALSVEAEELTERLSNDRNNIYSNILVVKNIENSSIFETLMEPQKSKPIRDTAVQIFENILDLENDESTKYLFKSVEKNIFNSGGCSVLRRSRREPYLFLLEYGLKNEFAKTNFQRALSYYYLLVGAKLNNDSYKYDELMVSFSKTFRQTEKFDLSGYDPFWITKINLNLEDKDSCDSPDINVIYKEFKNNVYCKLANSKTERINSICGNS